MNARKGDHEERAEDAPKWVSVPRETGEPKGVKGYSGSIKRVDKVNEDASSAEPPNKNLLTGRQC